MSAFFLLVRNFVSGLLSMLKPKNVKPKKLFSRKLRFFDLLSMVQQGISLTSVIAKSVINFR